MTTLPPVHNCSICQSTTINARFHCPGSCRFHGECIQAWVKNCVDRKVAIRCPNCNAIGNKVYAKQFSLQDKVKGLEDRIKDLQMENLGLKHSLAFTQFSNHSGQHSLKPATLYT